MMILQIAVLLGVISMTRCEPWYTAIENVKREIAHLKIDMECEIASLKSVLKDTQQV